MSFTNDPIRHILQLGDGGGEFNIELLHLGDAHFISQSLRRGAALLDRSLAEQTETLVLNIKTDGEEETYTVGMIEPGNQPNVQRIADQLNVAWRSLVITPVGRDDFRDLFSVAYGTAYQSQEERDRAAAGGGKNWQDLVSFHKEPTLGGDTPSSAAAAELPSLGDKKADNAKELGEHIIRTAIEQKASDIHFDMGPEKGMVRIRIDGCLYSRIRTRLEDVDFSELPNEILLQVCGAFGAKAEVNYNDMLAKPQDGSFLLPYIADKKVAKSTRLRFASIPRKVESSDQRGVKVTLRINQEMITNLDALGAHPEVIDMIRKGLHYNGGIGLFMGPTGSGKTNFISSCHTELRKNYGKILMEQNDTIEQMFDGICQTETSPECTEDDIYKSWLRHDPDGLIASEIRDGKSAESLVKIAVAGKLVLTTVHASSLTETFIRLEKLGIDRYTQAETLRFIVFTTLVRKLCVKCRVKGYTLRGTDSDEFEYVSSDAGCVYCNYRGYKGRTSVAEALTISPEVSQWISAGLPGTEVCRRAEEAGFMFPLHKAIHHKVFVEKVTSRAEILRVIDLERRIVQNRKEEDKKKPDDWRDQPTKKETDDAGATASPRAAAEEPHRHNHQPMTEPPIIDGEIIETEEVADNDFAIEIDSNWKLTDDEIDRSVNQPAHFDDTDKDILGIFDDQTVAHEIKTNWETANHESYNRQQK